MRTGRVESANGAVSPNADGYRTVAFCPVDAAETLLGTPREPSNACSVLVAPAATACKGDCYDGG